jgi:hypothetical protein
MLRLLTRKVGNRVRGVLQVYGSTPIKRRLWDREFGEHYVAEQSKALVVVFR